MRTHLLAAALAGLTSGVGVAGPTPAMGPCLTAAAADQRARGASAAEGRLTALLPAAWPPAGAPAVRYFDFQHQPLPTGVVSYAVFSPSVEITVPLDGGPVRTRALGKRERLGVDRPGPEARASALASSSAALVIALCARRLPTPAEAAVIREGYRAWLEHEPLVRQGLEREAAAFLRWLFEAPPPPGSTARPR